MLNTQRKLENFNHQTVYMVTKLGFIEPVRFESSTDYKKITTTSFPYQTMEFEINELEKFIQFINLALYLADTSAEILKNQLLTNYLETADDKHLNELAKKRLNYFVQKIRNVMKKPLQSKHY